MPATLDEPQIDPCGTSAPGAEGPTGRRVAVVGAGPGGLAAAAMLAASGASVSVLERRHQIGGRTGQLDLDGFRFDRGPTFFLMPYVLDEIFAACGERLADHVELTRLDPMYRLVVGQEGSAPVTIDATQDIDEMTRRIGRVSEADAANFRAFIADNRAKLDAAEPILRRPIRSLLDLVRPDAMRAGAHIKPHLTVHGLLSQYFKHPAVQLAVSFQSKYLGMSPYDCPSLFTILPYIEYAYGVWHPKGGCHQLMHALSGLVTKHGGEIRTGADVTKLTFSGNSVKGVEVNGAEERFDHVVLNADAAHAMRTMIPERLRPNAWSDAAIDNKRYSCSTVMLYVGVDGAVDLPHHTIYTSKKYLQNLEDIGRDKGRGGTLSEDPSFYVCNPSRIDPTMAPAGKSALYVLMPCPNTRADIDWDAQKPALREIILDQMEQRLSLDIRPRIQRETMLTPADWQADGIQFGATFNLAHNLGQMLHKRVPNELPGARGVWFVGGGTHPGSGLPVIFLSSQITAKMLAGKLGLGDPTLPVRSRAAVNT
ncbi:MAG: phytoene desaturase family protein [Planctomycetota bacterium]